MAKKTGKKTGTTAWPISYPYVMQMRFMRDMLAKIEKIQLAVSPAFVDLKKEIVEAAKAEKILAVDSFRLKQVLRDRQAWLIQFGY